VLPRGLLAGLARDFVESCGTPVFSGGRGEKDFPFPSFVLSNGRGQVFEVRSTLKTFFSFFCQSSMRSPVWI